MVDVVVLERLDVSSLVEMIEAEHQGTLLGLQSALDHAIRAGELLYTVKGRLAVNEWRPWVEGNVSFTLSVAYAYVRLYVYRDQIDTASPGIKAALADVKGLPTVGLVGSPRHAGWTRDEARTLRSQGMTYAAVSEVLGVPEDTVYQWVNPDKVQAYAARRRERARRDKAARQALAQKERDAAVKAKGGQAAVAYANIRKAASALDRALSETGDANEREALTKALAAAHASEDLIVRALRLGRRGFAIR